MSSDAGPVRTRTPPVSRRVAGAPRRPGRLGEVALATLVSAVIAVAMTWPALRDPRHTVPGDIGDPLLQAWQVAWNGHAALTQPLRWFDSNTFWPLDRSLAFSDALLGYFPAGLLGRGPEAALVRYDVLVVAAFALCGVGAYLLCRQLGASRGAAVVGGLAFAYAPWRYAQLGHLQVLSGGGVALALALLLRGHAGVRRGGGGRPGTALAGWAVAAWQVSLGFGIGLWFGYGLAVVLVIGVVRWWRAGRRWPGRALAVADLVGLIGFVAISGALTIPYFQVVRTFPSARRGLDAVALFSPPWQGLLVPPEINRVWSGVTAGLREQLAFPPEMALAVGATLVVLAVLGLLAGPWSRGTRVGAALAVVGLVDLLLGTTYAGGWFGYRLVYDVLPGFDAIRTPGRLVQPLTLLLAVLAAAGVDRLRRALPAHAAARAAPVLLAALVLVEGAAAVPTPRVPPLPVDLSTLAAPILVLTPDELTDTQVMLWSTDGFPPVVNGVSGFVPPPYALLRAQVATFPAPAAVEALREYGVRTVVVPDRAYAVPTAELLDLLSTAGLVARHQGDAVVVTL